MTNDQVPTGYNNTYAFDNPNLTYATVDGPISAYSDQTVTDKVNVADTGAGLDALKDKVNVADTGAGLDALKDKVDVADTGAGLDALKDKVDVADTGAGLDALKDKVDVADTGAGKTDAEKVVTDQAVKDSDLQKAITDANLTPANVTPTVTSTNMGSPYLLGQALTLGGAGSAFRLGSDVTPKQIYNSYNTPDKFTPATWDKTAMDTYMSPYTQGVVDIALREAERQRGIERLRENTAATQSGAFGGYRQGVVEAEGERNYNQSRNDITAKGYQNAYTDAVSQFAADRAAKQAAYTANQQALQAAATGDISAGQYNQANKFQAFTNQLNALNQGVNNVQNLSALETAYQNAMGNAGAALTSTDASARASDQATIDALKQLGIDITNVDWTKAQNLSTLAGLSQNNSNVQIKQSN
jgi:translation elongation factor EF-1beta